MVTLWNLFTITYSENLNMYLIALFQLSFDPNSKKSFYLKVIQCHTLKEEVHHYQKCLQVFTSVYIFSFENLENMINSCVLARYFAGETNANRRGSLEGNGIHQSTEFII